VCIYSANIVTVYIFISCNMLLYQHYTQTVAKDNCENRKKIWNRNCVFIEFLSQYGEHGLLFASLGLRH
jgi:hypothetical protein